MRRPCVNSGILSVETIALFSYFAKLDARLKHPGMTIAVTAMRTQAQ